MSKPLVRRIEVLDDLTCNSGTAKGVVDWVSAVAEESFDGLVAVERLKLTVPRVTYYLSEITAKRILRVVYEDETFDEYRIARFEDSAYGTGLLTILANGIIFDLAEQATKIAQAVANLLDFNPPAGIDTPANQLSDWVIAFGPSHITLGTVTPTDVIEPSVSGTPLAAAIAIATAANLAAGASYELWLQRNGTTDYQLYLGTKGGSAGTAYLRGGFNLADLSRVRDTRQQTTRGYPTGADGRGCGDAWWLVSATDGSTYIEITDISGSAVNPIVADDQLNGLYVVFEDATTKYQISATDKANQRLTLSSFPGSSPSGKWVRVCANSSGDQLPYVDDPDAQASYGIILGDLSVPAYTGLTNWAKNGQLSDWSSTDPTSWSRVGTAATKVTTIGKWRTGGHAAQLSASSSLGPTARSIYLPAGAVVTFVFWVLLDAYGGATTLLRTQNPNTAANDDAPLDGTVSGLDMLGVWASYSKSYTIASAGAKTLTALLITGTTPGTIYLDAVDVLVNVPALPGRSVRDSEAASQWLTMVQHLETNSAPIVSYDVTPVDLTRADGAQFPHADLVHGATLNLVEPDDLAITDSQRIVRIETTHEDPVKTRIQVASRRLELTQVLASA